MAKRQLATIRLIFGILFSILVCTLGKLECEDLPIEDCAFSVASTGTRCVLEKYKGKDDSIQYECLSSIIMAEKQEEWIESDECIKACGLERMSVGLSTDLLMDFHFAEMFCSSECLNNCPNLIDLYISLAAGEGMYLPQLCKAHRTRRVIADPVKKAMDAEYLRSLLPKLTSGGTMAPEGSPTPENGAATIPSGLLPKGPDYRGYGGSSGDIFHASGGEFTPTSPVSGSDTSPPLEKTAMGPSRPPWTGPSIHKHPFFFVASSPPTPSANIQSIPVSAATPEAGPVPPPESGISPSIAMSETAPASSEVSLQQQVPVMPLPDSHQLNDEEYLYETYFP